MALKAPTRRTTSPNAGAAPKPAPKANPIPFRRASRKKSQLGFQLAPVALTAAAQPLTPVEIPPAGFLRFIDLIVTSVAAGNAANVAFNSGGAANTTDAPFNVISQISVTTAAGDPIIIPVTGYQLYLMNKYASGSRLGRYADTKLSRSFSTTLGTGATAGSFSFTLRIPFEIDPATGFCSVPNLAANRSYQLNITLAPSTTVFATAPTALPTINISGIMWFWSQPYANNPAGVPQTQSPLGDGSVSAWRYDTPNISGGGDKLVKMNNVGNVIRALIFILRDANGFRDVADWPAITTILLNNDVLFYLPTTEWQDQMVESFGLEGATMDTAGALDTGVFVLPWFNTLSDGIWKPSGPKDQYLVTLDATLLQIRGTSFGASAQTLQVLTNEIKPVNAGALYAHL